MNAVNELTAQIQSPEFSAKINLASGRHLLIRILESDEVVLSLIAIIREAPEHALQILSRVEQLSRLHINPRYENPNDTAIATYCWALFQADPDLGRIAATFAASAAGVWWAREIAVFILENRLAAQKDLDMEATAFSPFADKLNFSFAQVNRSPSLEGVLPILVTLVTDVYKYIIVTNFAKSAEASDRPKREFHTWRDEEVITIVSEPDSVNDTELVFGWS